MSEREHEHWRDELAAYLLGALEPGEAAELEGHVEGCVECRAELHWLRPTIQVIPESVERVEPSPRLRARVMEEVRADAEASKAHAEISKAHAEASKAPGRRESLSAQRPGARSRWWAGRLGLRPVAGLAAALVVVAIAGYAIGVGGSGKGGDATTVAAGHAPGVTAKMVSEGDRGTLHLANVEQLPKGKVLEAWVRRDGRVVAVRSLFVPDREGRASTQLPDMRGVDVVMVTAEPRGGSDRPTSTPIVTMAVPQ